MIDQYLKKIKAKESLTVEEARTCLKEILEADIADEVIADLLIALAEKGESVEEITGFSNVLIENATKINIPKDSIELVGTGGCPLRRFNISTTASFVLAAGGVPVAKHGNRGSRIANGSFDLLERLECLTPEGPPVLEHIFQQTNICFLFARDFHPAMKKVAKARQIASRRTIFNLIGPLCNPVQPYSQIIGAINEKLAGDLAQVLGRLGRKHAYVVVGEPGIDEISISGNTTLFEIKGDKISRSQIHPQDFGIPLIPYDALPGGNYNENYELFMTLLILGKPESLLDMLCLNAGVAFYCFGKTPDIAAGYALSREIVTSGSAYEKFTQFRNAIKKAAG